MLQAEMGHYASADVICLQVWASRPVSSPVPHRRSARARPWLMAAGMRSTGRPPLCYSIPFPRQGFRTREATRHSHPLQNPTVHRPFVSGDLPRRRGALTQYGGRRAAAARRDKTDEECRIGGRAGRSRVGRGDRGGYDASVGVVVWIKYRGRR
jgi:hypothetical protein